MKIATWNVNSLSVRLPQVLAWLATNPVDAVSGTIRGDLAIETGRNVVHGSDSATSAAREIALHFEAGELVDYKRIDEAWLYE